MYDGYFEDVLPIYVLLAVSGAVCSIMGVVVDIREQLEERKQKKERNREARGLGASEVPGPEKDVEVAIVAGNDKNVEDSYIEKDAVEGNGLLGHER